MPSEASSVATYKYRIVNIMAAALNVVSAAMVALVLLVVGGVTAVAENPAVSPEVRGVWLTTNGGLDWPRGAKGAEAQKKALVDMLDRLEKAHFNLVLFQVQANGDVLWKSRREPAMEAVTGNGSSALDFDVCRFVIDECHKRRMECHAWIVPFRMGSSSHIARYKDNAVKHPGQSRRKYCVSYRGTMWLDPGVPDNRKWLVGLDRELVRAYDFDGLSLDYTRYPGADFPDSRTYKRYAPKHMSLAEWRRTNLNSFVAELYDMVAEERPEMMVGSAPIGTYKNVGKLRNSTAYDSFYQDPVEWISSGHHDFIAPQMYWDEKFGYSVNLETWVREAANSAPVAAGLAAYKMMDAGWSDDVIVDQIAKARKMNGVSGVVFFRAEHVVGNDSKARRLYSRLCDKIFASPAPLPWFSGVTE